MKVAILNIIGENCITLEDGQKIYSQILPELSAGHKVELDFKGVGVFASPFFNAAIGRLLNDFTRDELNRLLDVFNITPVGRDILKLVIKNSARYYDDPDYRKNLNKILFEQAEVC